MSEIKKPSKKNKTIFLVFLFMIYNFGNLLSASADDTDIFFSPTSSNSNTNILFVIDTSKSMENNSGDPTSRTKIDIVLSALSSLFSQMQNVNVGAVGYQGQVILPLNDVNALADPVSETTWGEEIINITRQMFNDYIGFYRTLGGGTMFAEGYYEAVRYYRGDSVDYGQHSIEYFLSTNNFSDYYENSGISHPNSFTGGTAALTDGTATNCTGSDLFDVSCFGQQITGAPTYISPLNATCAGGVEYNYIIIISDGLATANYDTISTHTVTNTLAMITNPIITECEALTHSFTNAEIDAEINRLIGIASTFFCTSGETAEDYHNGTMGTSCLGFVESRLENFLYPNKPFGCTKELSHFVANNDQSTESGTQYIRTYSIGFGYSSDHVLQEIAEISGGSYFEITNSSDMEEGLLDICTGILTEIEAVNESINLFATPSVNVNSFTRLTHRNELYFSLFKPEPTSYWQGNLKRYALGEITSGGDTTIGIVDVNGNAAVDETTGFFKTSGIRSFWSIADDNNDITAGGAANLLPDPATNCSINTTTGDRLIYTYTGVTNDLTNNSNRFGIDGSLTKSMLNIDDKSDAYKTELIQWACGLDMLDINNNTFTTTENRKQLYDGLHTTPIVVTYGGTENSPDDTIYYADNAGFLHAIDADTGIEIFSFIPPELLPNLNTLYQNNASENHVYGIDGPLVSWIKDSDQDGIIEPSDGDHVYLYFGMRRGGYNYYALDVTDRSSPKLLWSKSNNDLPNMGQTWSRPIKTKVKKSNTTYEVLLFAGGYDPDQDDKTYRNETQDDAGHQIFMLDASTGVLYWYASSDPSAQLSDSDFKYSIPADIRILDSNNDGLMDQFYTADMGGQIWRFDVDNTSSTWGNLVTGDVIADLGADNDTTNFRRFFYAPDLSLITNNGSRYLVLSIGSGSRATPLDTTVNDKFYVIWQQDGLLKPASYNKITETDLYDASNNVIGEGATESARAAAQASLDSKSGWYINLENSGEKVTGSSLTFSNKIYFTTYTPATSDVISNNALTCNLSVGTSRLYIVNLADATPTSDQDGSGDVINLTKSDRHKTLKTLGLATTPQYYKIKDSNSGLLYRIICTGLECDYLGEFTPIEKTYWVSD